MLRKLEQKQNYNKNLGNTGRDVRVYVYMKNPL